MRTRLDEIVEEEDVFGHWDSKVTTAAALRIAERAFRHGVERAIAATDVISGHTFDFNGKGWMNAVQMGVEAARKQMANVQPAPAMEKVEEGRYVCPHERCQMHHLDWRKGERRKFTSRIKTEEFLVVGGGWWYVAGEDTLRRDRRSGEDRRKP